MRRCLILRQGEKAPLKPPETPALTLTGDGLLMEAATARVCEKIRLMSKHFGNKMF
jgi:hypothetical protein